ncbi:hypothetical protein [Streptomyces griseorubiginosus]|uniref:hypothetical protein n=1 Tax=Streptomyces griseorubiginosus TaxID=67304 RepID=UPI00200F4EAA|nr:hypothetical protein [Streptomyces griseorubiginosus]
MAGAYAAAEGMAGAVAVVEAVVRLEEEFAESARAALDRYKARINLYVGDVKGVNPSDPKNVLGLYPVDQNGTQG